MKAMRFFGTWVRAVMYCTYCRQESESLHPAVAPALECPYCHAMNEPPRVAL